MTLKIVREKAKTLQIKYINQYRKDTLIRAIQEAEGNSPCFRNIPDCQIHGCLWRDECTQ